MKKGPYFGTARGVWTGLLIPSFRTTAFGGTPDEFVSSHFLATYFSC